MNEHAAALGRLGGLAGGPARARALSPARRSEISRKAARVRWSRDRVHRMRKARELSEATGADVGIVEQVLLMQTFSPREKLERGLRRSRLGRRSS